MEPISPGEILVEEYMRPYGLSQNAVAAAIGVDPMRISQIVRGTRAISADTALRLSRLFGTSDLFWLNLQDRYEIERLHDTMGPVLERIEPVRT
ncbi:HigA family addiction module antitoxin [Pseudonocardia sp. HH130630-07]|uniref:HigA family addiction module antitoxin n=1 Tax=Pseudonocardia sp. HH130630-07 TaxID=1690815 RepID=UPI000814F023|nr:pirin [Pseudonocardia sp. HH130630-07]